MVDGDDEMRMGGRGESRTDEERNKGGGRWREKRMYECGIEDEWRVTRGGVEDE